LIYKVAFANKSGKCSESEHIFAINDQKCTVIEVVRVKGCLLMWQYRTNIGEI